MKRFQRARTTQVSESEKQVEPSALKRLLCKEACGRVKLSVWERRRDEKQQMSVSAGVGMGGFKVRLLTGRACRRLSHLVEAVDPVLGAQLPHYRLHQLCLWEHLI
jgi:hypothetical protein